MGSKNGFWWNVKPQCILLQHQFYCAKQSKERNKSIYFSSLLLHQVEKQELKKNTKQADKLFQFRYFQGLNGGKRMYFLFVGPSVKTSGGFVVRSAITSQFNNKKLRNISFNWFQILTSPDKVILCQDAKQCILRLWGYKFCINFHSGNQFFGGKLARTLFQHKNRTIKWLDYRL